MSDKNLIAPRKVERTETSARDAATGRSRILARQLARPLTAEEIEAVAGALQVDSYPTSTAGTCGWPDTDC
jgi:hypothetical protein